MINKEDLKSRKIRVNNKEEFDKVTDILIKNGCKWFDKTMKQHKWGRFLFINIDFQLLNYNDLRQFTEIDFKEIEIDDSIPKVLKIINGVEYC